MIVRTFPENLKRLADEKGVTLEELAEKIAVSDVRLKKLMDEQAPLRPIEIVNLLLYFDCRPTEIFGNMFEGYFDE